VLQCGIEPRCHSCWIFGSGMPKSDGVRGSELLNSGSFVVERPGSDVGGSHRSENNGILIS
jgi:hypothetical protein